MQAHTFQQNACSTLPGPYLNLACKEDPAHLGEKHDAINLDLLAVDEFTGTVLKNIRNFVQGDVCEIETIFPDHKFQTAILGEFLEHVSTSYGHKVLDTIHRFLPAGGNLVLTFPLDDRPAKGQHGADKLKVLVGTKESPDFTTWHSHRWTDEELDELLSPDKWTIKHKEVLHYGFTKNGGWGLVLEKNSAE